MMLEGTSQLVIAWDWYSTNTSTLPTTSRDRNKQSNTTSAQSHRGIERKLMELECFKEMFPLKLFRGFLLLEFLRYVNAK